MLKQSGRKNGSHPSSDLLGERLHQGADAVFGHHRRVEDKLLVVVLGPFDVERVGHQRVPVVQAVELRRDAVLVLEALVEEELGVELELEVVATEMLHVVLDHNLDGLTCRSYQVVVNQILEEVMYEKVSNVQKF